MEKIILVLNYLFALSMPFTHVVGYFTAGIAFFLSFTIWKRLRHEKLFFWLKVFMIYGFIRAMFSADPDTGYMAMVGYLTQWIFPFLLGYLIADFTSFKKAFWIYYITFAVLVGFSILAFFGLFFSNFGEFEFAKEGLLKGGRSHIALAALCVLASFFSLGNYLYNTELLKGKKYVLLFAVFFFLGAVFLTGSRGYYMAGLAVYLIFGAGYLFKSTSVSIKWRIAAVAAAAAGIAVLYMFSPTIRARIHKTNYNDGSVQERLSLYKVALWEIKANPVFGVGPGQGTKQEEFYKMLPEQAQTASLKHHGHLHSFYLNFAAEFGVLGLVILFFIFYTILKSVHEMHKISDGLFKAVAFGLFWGFIGIMLGDCLDTLLRGPGVAMELFWLTGLLMGQRNFNS
jgi:O-antigen ligase